MYRQPNSHRQRTVSSVTSPVHDVIADSVQPVSNSSIPLPFTCLVEPENTKAIDNITSIPLSSAFCLRADRLLSLVLFVFRCTFGKSPIQYSTLIHSYEAMFTLKPALHWSNNLIYVYLISSNLFKCYINIMVTWFWKIKHVWLDPIKTWIYSCYCFWLISATEVLFCL